MKIGDERKREERNSHSGQNALFRSRAFPWSAGHGSREVCPPRARRESVWCAEDEKDAKNEVEEKEAPVGSQVRVV